MRQPNLLIRLAVVASSVLLLGGFVAYRAGAFDWVVRGEAQVIMGGSKMKTVFEPGAAEQAISNTTDPSHAIMSGSKTAIFVIPPTADKASATPTGAKPTIMPGSKSLAPLIPPAPGKSNAPAPANKPSTPTILPGSKSDALIKPPALKTPDPATGSQAPAPTK